MPASTFIACKSSEQRKSAVITQFRILNLPQTSCPLLFKVPEPLQTLSYRRGTLWVLATQMGGGGIEVVIEAKNLYCPDLCPEGLKSLPMLPYDNPYLLLRGRGESFQNFPHPHLLEVWEEVFLLFIQNNSIENRRWWNTGSLLFLPDSSLSTIPQFS